MNFKYLFVVLLGLSFLYPKDSFAQNEIDIDLNSIDKNKSLFDDDEEDLLKEKTPKAVVTSTPGSFQPAGPLRKVYFDDYKYKWYIQLGAGAQALFGEDEDKGSFKNLITLAPSITGGYRWNRIFGARLNITGGSLHGYNDGHSGKYSFWDGKSDAFKEAFAAERGLPMGIKEIERWDPTWDYKGWTISSDGMPHGSQQIYYNPVEGAEGYHWILGREDAQYNQLYMQHVRYIAANAALTVNLFNLFGSDEEYRKFDMSIHLGPSYYHVFPHMGLEAGNYFGANGGGQMHYHINDYLGVFGELNAMWVPEKFDGHYGSSKLEFIGQATLGLTYKFPTVAAIPTLPPVTITDETNDELNRLRAELMGDLDGMVDLQPEIDRLRQQLAELQAKPEVVVEEVQEKESFFLPDPVHFIINRSDILPEGYDVIADVAKYLNEHPTATVIVTGYADKDTGTKAINERLSRERSNNVADALSKRYNIDPSRISVDWRGDSVQPFYRNQMNRAVLFYIEFNKNK